MRQVDIMSVMSSGVRAARLCRGFGGPCHDNAALSDMPSGATCRDEVRPKIYKAADVEYSMNTSIWMVACWPGLKVV